MKFQYRIIKITPTKMSKKEIKSEGFDHNELLKGRDVHTYNVDISIQREDRTDLGVYSICLFPFNRYGPINMKSNRKMKNLFRTYLFPKETAKLSKKDKEDTLLAEFLIELRKSLQKTFYQINTFEG